MPIKMYKPIGITPLELIDNYKKENNIKCKMSFAGRLDPMAHGEMILLEGEECKSQNLYCGKDKVYEFKILYGVKTDTLDILGLLEESIISKQNNIGNFIGKFLQPYPIFSSIYVKKKPLWWWAKNGIINEIEIPKKEIEIYELEKMSETYINNLDLLNEIIEKLSLLSLDNREKFRFVEIKKEWEILLSLCENKNKIFNIETYICKVSSGTYIRSLCERMGGIAYDIKRVKIIL